jgi:DNA polymerase-3 subunit gamma/tau
MSYQVIARKYRPPLFDEVVGQRVITETLKNAILTERVAHGYIFSGARGVGKTTTARILAKALNCVQGPTITPCGACPSCVEIAAGNSVDVLEIDAASNRGIDEIRELRETVRYLPARDRYKVFIIDEAHMLTAEAFNALLKTLEEPPPRSLFILATTEAHKLPATIQSRCQHFAFRLLDYAEIYARLAHVCGEEKVQADEGALSAVTQAAEGSLRDALSLLDQVIAACGEQLDEGRVRQLLGIVPSQLLSEMIRAIHAGDARPVLEGVDRLVTDGYELSHFCGQFTRYVRNLMLAKNCGSDSPLLQVPNDERSTLAELAQALSEEDLTRFFQVLLRTEGEMRYSLQPRFHLELGLLKLVHARKLASLESLLTELRAGATGSGAPKPPAGSRPPVSAPGPARSFKTQAATAAPTPASPGSPAVGLHGPVSRPATTPVPPAIPGQPEDSRLAAIKSLASTQSNLLGSLLEAVVGWRFENGTAQFLLPKQNAWAVDILQSQERQETLRSVCAQVLGESVKIRVTLEEREGPAAPVRLDPRARAERDARVAAFLRKFEGTLVDTPDLDGE